MHALQLLQQENAKLHVQLDAITTSSHLSDAQHRANLDDMQCRLDDTETRMLARQQRIDELTRENERLSEQLLTVSSSTNIYYSKILVTETSDLNGMLLFSVVLYCIHDLLESVVHVKL